VGPNQTVTPEPAPVDRLILGGAQCALLARPEQAEPLTAVGDVRREKFGQLGDVDLAVRDRLGHQLLQPSRQLGLQIRGGTRDLVDFVGHSGFLIKFV